MDWNERQIASDTFAKERESNKNYGSRRGGQKDVEENGATDNIVRLADCSAAAAAKKNVLRRDNLNRSWGQNDEKMPTVDSTDVASTSFHFILIFCFRSTNINCP